MRRHIRTFGVVAALSASKHSIAASAIAGVVGAITTTPLGYDPWVWIVSTVGSVISIFKMPPSTRKDTLTNGVIGVMLGGLAGPFSVDVATHYTFPAPPVLLCCFLIALCWPVIIKYGKEWWSDRRKNGNSN